MSSGSRRTRILSSAVLQCTEAKTDEGQRQTDPIHNRARDYLFKVGNFSALVHPVFQVQSNYIKLNLLFHLPPGHLFTCSRRFYASALNLLQQA